jgi:hypothetical protein
MRSSVYDNRSSSRVKMRCEKCAVLDESCGVEAWVNLDVAGHCEWVRRRLLWSIDGAHSGLGDCSGLLGVGGGDSGFGVGLGGRSDSREKRRGGAGHGRSWPRSRRRRLVRLQDRAPLGDRLLAEFARALIAAVSGPGRVQRGADDGPVDPDFAEQVREDDGVVVGGEEAATLVLCYVQRLVRAIFSGSTARRLRLLSFGGRAGSSCGFSTSKSDLARVSCLAPPSFHGSRKRMLNSLFCLSLSRR